MLPIIQSHHPVLHSGGHAYFNNLSSLVLQCHACLGYEATASLTEPEHIHYVLPETFLAPFAVATIYRSPRPELLFR